MVRFLFFMAIGFFIVMALVIGFNLRRAAAEAKDPFTEGPEGSQTDENNMDGKLKK